MIEFTKAASGKVKNALVKEDNCLRMTVTGVSAKGYQYNFSVDEEQYMSSTDELISVNDFKVLIAKETVNKLRGATVDWQENELGTGNFVVDNPNDPKVDANSPEVKKLQEVLDTEINPAVASHGGYVELVDYQNGRVFLKLGGGCQGCGMADATLKQGIEVVLKEEIPSITEVIDVTEHAEGKNPYYAG